MVTYLRGRIGEDVVVRSDDIDGNDIIGTATTADGAVFRFRAHADDAGAIQSADIDQA